MRTYFFWIILLLLAGSAVVFFFQADRGYILVQLGDVTVETTVWLLAFAVTVLAIIVWFIVRFAFIVWSYPKKISSSIEQWTHKSRKKTVDHMLLAYFSGDYTMSEKYATRFKEEQLSTAFGQFVRIEAMLQQGKLGIAEQLIKRNLVAKHDKNHRNIFLCLQMQLALQKRQYAVVEKVYMQLPANIRKQQRWSHIYWQALLALGKVQQLVSQLPSPYAYTDDNQEVILRYYQKALQTLVAQDDRELFHWFWKRIPPKLQQQRQFAESYVRFLLSEQNYTVLEQLLCRFASIESLGALMQYWGDFPAPKVRNSLKALEKIYVKQPYPWLSLGLGRLCLNLQLWGKAENYLRTALDKHSDEELRVIILITLAKLYHKMGDKDKAANYFNQVESVHLLPSEIAQ